MQGKLTAFFAKTIAVYALMLISFNMSAQAIYSIKLKLVDDKTGQPVAYATASVTAQGENTPEKYVLTDSDGMGTIVKTYFSGVFSP